MKVIALTGFAGSGKSTVAQHLELLMRSARLPFAGVLKDVAQVLFDLDRAQMHTQEGKRAVDERWGTTPRDLLQRFGTEAMRGNFGTDFWIKRWQIEAQKHKDCVVLVEDQRFPNESTFMQSIGAVRIGIWRGAHPTQCDTTGWHDSERYMAECWSEMVDVEIENNGSLQELYRKVNALVRELGFEIAS